MIQIRKYKLNSKLYYNRLLLRGKLQQLQLFTQPINAISIKKQLSIFRTKRRVILSLKRQ